MGFYRFLANSNTFTRAFNANSLERFYSTTKSFEHILVSSRGNVGIVQLNRPKALNALCSDLFTELNEAMNTFDKSQDIRAIVLTGSERSFAAGADIKEMKDREFIDNYKQNFLGHWTEISKVRKPIIAAVNGFALGGGCELAMMCDIIYAGSEAKFGQPEIKLGTIPGAGGTQRLAKAIGKSKAMEMVLTGNMMTATEAQQAGLVSKVFPKEAVFEEAVKTATEISKLSLPIILMAKEAVNKSFELPLFEGLNYERRIFHETFATHDQKEGMAAFSEKRKPDFHHK